MFISNAKKKSSKQQLSDQGDSEFSRVEKASSQLHTNPLSNYVKNKNWDSHSAIGLKSKPNRISGQVAPTERDSVLHTLFKDGAFKIDEKDEMDNSQNSHDQSFSFRKDDGASKGKKSSSSKK